MIFGALVTPHVKESFGISNDVENFRPNGRFDGNSFPVITLSQGHTIAYPPPPHLPHFHTHSDNPW